jgi:PIN domain nuclease of toxin-antitoxin system
MAFLLDTHVFYWVMRDSPLLRTEHRQLLIATDEPVIVSAVSGWEIATKVRLGKWPEAAPLLPGLEGASKPGSSTCR